MGVIDRLGYVAIGVPDIDEAITFFTSVMDLAVTGNDGTTAYLTATTDHHSMVLTRRDEPGWFRLGYQLTGPAALDAVRVALDKAGIDWEESSGLGDEFIADAIRFTVPQGPVVELYCDVVSFGTPPFNRVLNGADLLHVVYTSDDLDGQVDLLTNGLGFMVSDWIERRACFMRSENLYHHSIGAAQGVRPGVLLDHACYLVDDLDSVMRFRNRAVAAGYGLRSDLLRHAASGSMSVYVMSPIPDFAVEVCFEHEQIPRDGRPPRILPARLQTLDVWQPLDIATLASAAASRQPTAGTDSVTARVQFSDD